MNCRINCEKERKVIESWNIFKNLDSQAFVDEEDEENSSISG